MKCKGISHLDLNHIPKISWVYIQISKTENKKIPKPKQFWSKVFWIRLFPQPTVLKQWQSPELTETLSFIKNYNNLILIYSINIKHKWSQYNALWTNKHLNSLESLHTKWNSLISTKYMGQLIKSLFHLSWLLPHQSQKCFQMKPAVSWGKMEHKSVLLRTESVCG
jgi:hypothetical protein